MKAKNTRSLGFYDVRFVNMKVQIYETATTTNKMLFFPFLKTIK